MGRIGTEDKPLYYWWKHPYWTKEEPVWNAKLLSIDEVIDMGFDSTCSIYNLSENAVTFLTRDISEYSNLKPFIGRILIIVPRTDLDVDTLDDLFPGHELAEADDPVKEFWKIHGALKERKRR